MSLHADYSVRWKNFRGFSDTGWVDLRPLTILIGPNNAGKSSITAPLLLFSQTVNSKDSLTPLVLRGPLADLGSFRDIIHGGDTSADLSLGFRYHVHQATDKTRDLGNYPPGSIELTLGSADSSGGAELKKFEIFDVYLRRYLARTLRKDGRHSLSGILTLKDLAPSERRAVLQAGPTNFLFYPSRVLGAVGSRDVDRPTPPQEFSAAFSFYLQVIGAAAEQLVGIFDRLTYVGPVRAHPSRYYQIEGENTDAVGPHGEHMANLLRRNLTLLGPQINRWIRAFEFGDGVVAEDLSADLFSLFFERKKPKRRTNIADAGFGASQVLPLIVQAFSASRGALTIAEQPEIHLNPRLQCVLADLLVEMATSDKRVVVETHSEHLLMRVRRLIAAGTISPDLVALYFVERVNGTSSIRRIPIEPNGHIQSDEWPVGFFEETLRESLALAALQ